LDSQTVSGDVEFVNFYAFLYFSIWDHILIDFNKTIDYEK